MAEGVITLKDFKGINLHEGLWSQGYAKHVVALDLFGLRDLDTFRSLPGVLQCEKRMIAGTEAAGPNDVTDLVRWMAQFSVTGNVWALSAPGASPRLYERTAGTWTLRRSTAGGDLTTTNGGGIADFADNLWIAQDSRVSRWTNAAYTQSFGTFSASGTTDRPMKVFAGNLYIGNGRYISMIDSTPTFTAAKLTLPSQVTVQAIEALGDRLYILCSILNYYRIYVWDGTSTTYQNFVDFREASNNTTIIAMNGRIWVLSGNSNTPMTYAYIFDGYSFTKVLSIPALFAGYQGAVAPHRGGLVFSGTDTTASGNYEGGNGGVWAINRHDESSPWHATLLFVPNNATTNSQPNAMYADSSAGGRIYVGHYDNVSAYTIWETDTSGATYTTGALWQSLPMDAGNAVGLKAWNAIRIDSESVGTSNNIIVDYRTDYATAWTTLKTISSNPNAYIPLGATSRVIEIRLRLGSILNGPADSASISTRLHGVEIFYEQRD